MRRRNGLPMRGPLKAWAHHEVEFLKVHYGQMSAQEIADALGRTKQSVHTMRKRLGLNMTKDECRRVLRETQSVLGKQRCGENNPAWKGGVSKVKSRYTRRFEQKFPEKFAAHKALRKAVRNGQVKKLPCQECGDPCSEGHHHDYTKPLDVTWLCKKHHIAADRARREREQSTAPSN